MIYENYSISDDIIELADVANNLLDFMALVMNYQDQHGNLLVLNELLRLLRRYYGFILDELKKKQTEWYRLKNTKE